MEDKVTSAGRKVYQDENGENYSEKTITFETEYGWINIPTVDENGAEMSQAELEEFVAENGPVDPVTGQVLPTYEDVESAEAAAKERSDSYAEELAEPQEMNCGGMMMDDMSVGYDPVSGNPVPPGSSEINVRDDIPAVLSEGEYVVPADVVRYHGLKTFMALREEAKMGLMAMAYEGQIKALDEEGYEMEEEEVAEDYETPEGTEVEVAEHEIEEEYMEPEAMEDDEEMYPTEDGQFAYRPTVSFAILKS